MYHIIDIQFSFALKYACVHIGIIQAMYTDFPPCTWSMSLQPYD